MTVHKSNKQKHSKVTELPKCRTLISNDDLRNKIVSVGDDLSRDYYKKEVVIVSVLTGALRFTGSLMARMDQNLVHVEPVVIRSYRGTKSGTPRPDYLGLSAKSVRGKHVLLVDDILDTGQTLGLLRAKVLGWRPASLKTVVMLHKEGCQRPEFDLIPDYLAFPIPNHFVVGFGLDYRGLFRNLNFIGILDDDQKSSVDHLMGSPEWNNDSGVEPCEQGYVQYLADTYETLLDLKSRAENGLQLNFMSPSQAAELRDVTTRAAMVLNELIKQLQAQSASS